MCEFIRQERAFTVALWGLLGKKKQNKGRATKIITDSCNRDVKVMKPETLRYYGSWIKAEVSLFLCRAENVLLAPFNFLSFILPFLFII